MSPFSGIAHIERKNKNKSRVREFILNPVNLNIGLIVLIAAVGFMYLMEVNQATTKGYKMRDLEKKISSIEEVNRKLELQITDLQSLNNVKQRVDDLGMVPSDKVKYIKIPGTSVALK